jgi:hypothetical protein
VISRAIIKELKADSDLTTQAGGAARLFAEIGQGEPAVIVKQNDKSTITHEIKTLKLARIQLLVSGYSIDEGEAIADSAIDLILALEGETIPDETRTFTLKSVSHLNGPVLITWKEANTLTANFTITFIEETI